jgi:ElaB/YqjD/DUF883 family membrane-anchored ribosome-binding protein
MIEHKHVRQHSRYSIQLFCELMVLSMFAYEEDAMLETTIKTRSDLKSLLMDAQDLFRDATSATGSKADELRNKGLSLLDTAIEKAQDAQSVAVTTSKEIAESAGDYVRENPWKAVAIVAGAALLASLLVKRRD